MVLKTFRTIARNTRPPTNSRSAVAGARSRGLAAFRCLPPPKLVIRISYVHNSIPSISEVKTNCRHGDYTEIDKRPQLKSRNAPNIGGFALVYRQFPLARRTQKNLLGAALRETFRPAFCFRACAL